MSNKPTYGPVDVMSIFEDTLVILGPNTNDTYKCSGSKWVPCGFGQRTQDGRDLSEAFTEMVRARIKNEGKGPLVWSGKTKIKWLDNVVAEFVGIQRDIVGILNRWTSISCRN